MNVTIHLYRDREGGLRARFDWADGKQWRSRMAVRGMVAKAVRSAVGMLAGHTDALGVDAVVRMHGLFGGEEG